MTDDRMTMDARAEAVEAIRRLLYDRGALLPGEVRTSSLPDAIFDALLSPRVVPCSEPGCGDGGIVGYLATGTERSEWTIKGTYEVCPACNGSGQVSLPPLAVLMGSLEQVGWWHWWDGDLSKPGAFRYDHAEHGVSRRVFRMRSREAT